MAQTTVLIPTCAGPALLDILGKSKFGAERSAFALHRDFLAGAWSALVAWAFPHREERQLQMDWWRRG